MTRKTFLPAALLLLATFVTSVAQAQQLPPGKWWRREAVVRQLQLSTDQQNQLDEIFRAAANELIDAKAEVEKLQIALRAEIEREQVRRAEVLKIAARLNDARGKLFERELMMLVDMRGVLNEQQWTTMRNFLDRMQEHRPMNQPRPDQRPQQRPNRRRP